MSFKEKKRKKVKKRERTSGPYPFEFRLRVVRLRLEDGYDVSMIAQEFGISEYSVYRWSKAYRKHGEKGLRDRTFKPFAFIKIKRNSVR